MSLLCGNNIKLGGMEKMVNFSLSNAQNKLIHEIREMAPQLEMKSLELDRTGDEHFDYSLVNILAKQDLLYPLIPVEYGGRGFDYITTVLYMEEIGAICNGLASVLISNGQVANIINMVGNKQQKEKYLPIMAEKKPHMTAIAMTEREAGSDIGAMKTHAAHDNEYFRITGNKDYMVNGAIADFIMCFAALDPTRARSTMTTFIVPGNADGLEVKQIRNKMGIRYAHTCEISFNNVTVPEANIVGNIGNGFIIATQSIDKDKVLTGAAGVGLARSAFEKALAFAKQRRQFGKAIIEKKVLAFEFAQMLAQIEAARLLVWKAAWLIDNNEDFTVASSIAKIAGTKVAQEVVAKAMDIYGGQGYLLGNPIEKLYRDAKMLSTMEGTNHVHTAIIASLL